VEAETRDPEVQTAWTTRHGFHFFFVVDSSAKSTVRKPREVVDEENRVRPNLPFDTETLNKAFVQSLRSCQLSVEYNGLNAMFNDRTNRAA
jgi:hypothetical protein